jgi:hypothetical protein
METDILNSHGIKIFIITILLHLKL